MKPTEPDREADRAHARAHAWREVDRDPEQLRRAALRSVDTAAVVAALEPAYRAARQQGRSCPTPGLVQQQQGFQRARR